MKSGPKRRLQSAAAERRRQKARVFTPLCVLAIAVLSTLIIACSLDACNALWIESRGAAITVLRPATALWLGMAFPIGAGAALLLSERVNAFFLGAPPPNFSAQHAYDAAPLPTWFKKGAVALVILFACLSGLNIRKHARLTDYDIVDQRTLKWHEFVYPYSQISSVSLNRHYIAASKSSRGGPSRDRSVFVTFQDGRRWSTVVAELSLDPNLNLNLANQIAELSGKSVEVSDIVVDEKTPQQERTAIARMTIFYFVIAAAIWLFRPKPKRISRD